jgi:putative DNA primase/helicase
MRQDDFEYVPKLKPFFSGNHKPGLRSVGVAMRRRMQMIPFVVTITEDRRDLGLEDKLKGEWPGILQWMIDGCLLWQEHGLAPPAAVTKTTDEYFEAQDSLSLWVADCCERDANAETGASTLFKSWKAWAEHAGVRYGTIQEFRDEMERAGFRWKRKETANIFEGLRIAVSTPEDDQ